MNTGLLPLLSSALTGAEPTGLYQIILAFTTAHRDLARADEVGERRQVVIHGLEGDPAVAPPVDDVERMRAPSL